MLVTKYGYKKDSASMWTPVPFMMISLVSPFFGAMIDKIGNRMTFVLITNLTPFLAMVWAMCSPKSEDAPFYAVIPLLLIGISNISILNIQQGSLIAFSVPPERLGVAFGLLYCVINCSYTLFPPILGVA